MPVMGIDDPVPTHPIGSALAWLEGTLLGTIATTVAVIAVASLGFMMLTGRIDLRRAAQVIMGCFIIFGASTIASGITAAVSAGGAGAGAQSAQAAPPSAAPSLPPPEYPEVAKPYDPYSGAALPSQ